MDTTIKVFNKVSPAYSAEGEKSFLDISVSNKLELAFIKSVI